MNETQTLAKEIRRLTILLTAILMGISIFVFPDQLRSVTMGILIGSLCGLLGFQMIVRMASLIQPDNDPANVKASTYRSYMHRYLVYALVFVAGALQGINVIAMLVGMLAHKASLLLYTWLHRKEDD